MSSPVVLHGLACARHPTSLPSVGRLRSIIGGFDRVVADISAEEQMLRRARRSLPTGAALAEASAVRLRRESAELVWGEPMVVRNLRDVLTFCAERGRSAVDIVRADPSLLTELQLGAWFDATWEVRLLRRLAAAGLRAPARMTLRLAADAAFWRGARTHASDLEWQRWTRTSYVALVYHRLAGERKPGQERVDLSPETFARQLHVLRRLGFRHLEPEELLGLHEAEQPAPLRRAFAITLDDGLLDCLGPLVSRPERGVQLFVPTAEVGGRAHWLDNEPLLGWEELRTLASAGVAVGSHARHHRPLVALDPRDLESDLERSRSDLDRELISPTPILAYPHGAHDETVRAAAAKAGFRAAFTTNKGRNGHGTDRYCLRRVSVHTADGALAVLWKVTTGEGLPRFWLRARRLRHRITNLASARGR